ncbi:MAG: hypothetical protein Q7S86_00305 [bacterium]|nr:hypothetical protein [bacterium]
MLVWTVGELHRTEEGRDPKALFDTGILRAGLGSMADDAWAICAKFAEKEMWFDAFVILLSALRKRNEAAVCVAIRELKVIWELIVARRIPSRLRMNPLEEETLANCFLLADSAINRGR